MVDLTDTEPSSAVRVCTTAMYSSESPTLSTGSHPARPANMEHLTRTAEHHWQHVCIAAQPGSGLGRESNAIHRFADRPCVNALRQRSPVDDDADLGQNGTRCGRPIGRNVVTCNPCGCPGYREPSEVLATKNIEQCRDLDLHERHIGCVVAVATRCHTSIERRHQPGMTFRVEFDMGVTHPRGLVDPLAHL